MADNTAKEVYDLLLVVDATSSMQVYLTALQRSLPRIISISALTGCFSRIGLLGYRDYTETAILDWSGWLDPAASEDDASQPNLLQKARRMHPEGGADMPEALKTALARAYELARPDATTLMLIYTDAPPHLVSNRVKFKNFDNYGSEQDALKKKSSFGGHGPAFADWVSACRTLRNGAKQFQVFSIVPVTMRIDMIGHFIYLSTLANGATIRLARQESDIISKVTIELLLAWMGVAKAGLSSQVAVSTLQADLVRYKDGKGINDGKHEDDPKMRRFFRIFEANKNQESAFEIIDANIARVEMNQDVLVKYLPKKKTALIDFAKQWAASASYREIAVYHLSHIIQNDVLAMATNPVFGTLWRAVCNDRNNPHRESLTKQFSERIEKISNPGDRQRMKTWLEESYDYGAEIAEAIEKVPENERFPCVCLDPTQTFEIEEDESGNAQPISKFTRAELLEISRSCDPRVLSRLSKVLTRLTYINTAEEMPEHIAATSHEKVPRIPLALMEWKHGHKFWRYLLHIIVPGTLLSARPAALLAALTLCIGLTPLLDSAEEEVKLNRDKWNDIEVPENWNTSCLSLLVDADDAYRARHPHESKSLLKSEDRALFKHLVAFHILELNLNTPLTARVGWTPNKSTAPIGPLLICRKCELPRSVTIMRKDVICGICAAEDYPSPEQKQIAMAQRASKDQTNTSPATWVECSMAQCRAQYVVYNVEDLNVRAKCHYCRQIGMSKKTDTNSKSMDAPTVECTKCCNRMIWPQQLRPKDFSRTEFICPACQFEHKTIVDTEVTPLKMQTSDGMTWLVMDTQNPTAFPFNQVHSQPIFKIATEYSPSLFLSRIKLLAPTKKPLTVNGKQIHDPATVRSTLESWIASRHVGKDNCSMCFSTTTRSGSSLTGACGRRGCSQKACRDCMQQWYGLNGAGRIINIAALSCPFCRRLAAGNLLRRYGNGVHAVPDLQRAIRDHGQWIHAWCVSCGHAKRYVARECARGMPAAVQNWRCETCTERRRAMELLHARIREQIMQGEADEAELERLHKELAQMKVRPVRLCPGCGVAIEKDGGCDHMECSVCHVHWCWVCSEAFSEESIARHMLGIHGGFFAIYGSEDEDVND